MTELRSPEVGMAAKIELKLGKSQATVRPNAEVTHLSLNGRVVLFPAAKLRTVSEPTDPMDLDAIPDTNVEGGSFVAWPFGRSAFDSLPTNPAIHGVGGLLTQWKTIPVSPELRSTVAVLEKSGGKYFEQAFGNDQYSLHRVVALTGSDENTHAQLSTTVAYYGNSEQDAQRQFYPLAEHTYFQVGDYTTARIALRGADGRIYTKSLREFEVENVKGQKVLDTECKNEDIEIEPGTVWLLPEGEGGPVTVITRKSILQRSSGETTHEIPAHWVLYHKMDSTHGTPAAVAIEAVTGEWEPPLMLSVGDRVTQTVNISTARSLQELVA